LKYEYDNSFVFETLAYLRIKRDDNALSILSREVFHASVRIKTYLHAVAADEPSPARPTYSPKMAMDCATLAWFHGPQSAIMAIELDTSIST